MNCFACPMKWLVKFSEVRTVPEFRAFHEKLRRQAGYFAKTRGVELAVYFVREIEGLSKLPQPKPKKPPQRKPPFQAVKPATPQLRPELPTPTRTPTRNGRPQWPPV